MSVIGLSIGVVAVGSVDPVSKPVEVWVILASCLPSWLVLVPRAWVPESDQQPPWIDPWAILGPRCVPGVGHGGLSRKSWFGPEFGYERFCHMIYLLVIQSSALLDLSFWHQYTTLPIQI